MVYQKVVVSFHTIILYFWNARNIQISLLLYVWIIILFKLVKDDHFWVQTSSKLKVIVQTLEDCVWFRFFYLFFLLFELFIFTYTCIFESCQNLSTNWNVKYGGGDIWVALLPQGLDSLLLSMVKWIPKVIKTLYRKI